MLLNSSQSPVWSVEVFIQRWQKASGPERPKPERIGMAQMDVGVTPPFGQPRYFDTGLENPDFEQYGYLYGIEFRDSSNNWWHRTPSGRLRSGKFSEKGRLRRFSKPTRYKARKFASLPGFGMPS
ncbi:MAG: hypothetical protein INR62_10115 [Rhodospirillales bacterium]|nr:hypothetical protein [Acetobacter sp.]